MERYLCTLATLAALACTSEATAPETPRCRLGAATELTRVAAARFDGIAVSRAPSAEVLAVWSVPAGTYARWLSGRGTPRAAAERITERCRGGLALAATAQGFWLACSRPSPVPELATLNLLSLDATGLPRGTQTLGLVGRDGAGVSVATDGNRLLIAFHDGTVQAYVARLAIVDGEQVTHHTLSDPTFAAGAPSIVARGGHWLATYSETRIGPQRSFTRVMLRGDGAKMRQLRETSSHEPAPLVAWDDISPWVSYRDSDRKHPRTELFATRLTSQLKPTGGVKAIGRANSEGAPSLLSCGAQRLALLPRDYADERYIGVHTLKPNLENTDSGHQYYANSRDFVLASGACLESGSLLLAGERKAPSDPGVSLMAIPFECATAHSGTSTPSRKR